jgi:hypothetical protein
MFEKVEEESKMVEGKEEIKTEVFDSYEFLDVVLEEQEENVKSDTSKKTLYCDQCGFLAGHPSTLKTHKNNVHKGISYNCEHCNHAASTSSLLHSHVENKHLGIRYECEDCDYKAGTKGNLKIHRLSKHLNIKFSCTFCDFQTPFQANLKKHVKAKHTDDEERQRNLKKCGLCEFTTLWNLKKHIRNVHKGEMIKCQWDGCDYQSHRKSSLDEHIKTMHEGFKFKCDDCDFQTTKMGDLQRHGQLKHGPNKHFCDQCDASFKLRSGLNVHIESAHLDINIPCDQCDYKSTCKKYLKTHMRRAHGSKHQCEYCEYVSKRPYLLKAHITSQHGQQNVITQQPAYQTPEQPEALAQQQTRSKQLSQQSLPNQVPYNLPPNIFNQSPYTSKLNPISNLNPTQFNVLAPSSTQCEPNLLHPIQNSEIHILGTQEQKYHQSNSSIPTEGAGGAQDVQDWPITAPNFKYGT